MPRHPFSEPACPVPTKPDLPEPTSVKPSTLTMNCDEPKIPVSSEPKNPAFSEPACPEFDAFRRVNVDGQKVPAAFDRKTPSNTGILSSSGINSIETALNHSIADISYGILDRIKVCVAHGKVNITSGPVWTSHYGDVTTYPCTVSIHDTFDTLVGPHGEKFGASEVINRLRQYVTVKDALNELQVRDVRSGSETGLLSVPISDINTVDAMLETLFYMLLGERYKIKEVHRNMQYFPCRNVVVYMGIDGYINISYVCRIDVVRSNELVSETRCAYIDELRNKMLNALAPRIQH